MVKVVIAGTGYPELAYWSGAAKTIDGAAIEVIGFLDDNILNRSRSLNGFRIVGGFSEIGALGSDIFVVNSIARSMELRRETTEILRSYGARFTTMVHETALVRTEHVGDGTIIGPYVVAEAGVSIGEHCCILGGTTIGHDSSLGNFCFAGHGVRIQGHVQVNDGVFMGSACCVFPDVVVGHSVTIGINATVISDIGFGKSMSAPISRTVR